MAYWTLFKQQSEYRTILDPISYICILGALFLFGVQGFVFLPNVGDPQILALVLRSSISFMFLLGGLVGMLFFGVHIPLPQVRGGDVDLDITPAEWTEILLWMGIDLFMIVLINFMTLQGSSLFAQSFINYPDSLLHFAIFSLAIGWTEEVFFRGFALPAVAKLYGDPMLSAFTALVVTTFGWWVFHGGVYGLDPSAMIVILMAGLVLGLSFIATNLRLSVVMAPHGVNNVLSILTQGATVKANLALPLYVKLR